MPAYNGNPFFIRNAIGGNPHRLKDRIMLKGRPIKSSCGCKTDKSNCKCKNKPPQNKKDSCYRGKPGCGCDKCKPFKIYI